MSRENKKRKEKCRRERLRATPKRYSSAPTAEIDLVDRIAGGEVYQLVSYDVTYDPMPDEFPENKEVTAALPIPGEDLMVMLTEQPKEAIRLLVPLLDRFPKAPVLYNWLSVAYSHAGHTERSHELAALNYQNNPDYLFARCNHAEALMHHERFEEVPAVFGGKWDLKQMYPDRNLFHYTEVLAICATAIHYYVGTNQREIAERYLPIMEKISPDATQTQYAQQLLNQSILLDALEKIKKLIHRPRRRP